MKYDFIRIERSGAKEILSLNHPPLNILTIRMMEEMIDALSKIANDSQLRLLILRGEGSCFSAGMDVAEHLPEKVRTMFEKMHSLMLGMADLEIPSIAVLHGSALGGGLELATMADFVFASRDTKLGQPEIKLGVFPPLAVAYFPQLIGVRHTYDLVLTGRTIDAEHAAKIGLINALFDSTELEAGVEKLAGDLLSKSRAAIASTKKALRKARASLYTQLSQAEEIYLSELMQTYDATEGLRAFLEKRNPEWRHR